ncbi:Synapse-associated protein 1 [Phytophthora cinnamomi]|uniref:Synapse-associated protein 1 n=1 Tax=Phytophthora cinnamomi TaxID=4785 RepID=UPI00355A6CFE|nr:Synapse-associated protein 1 [Phytophthora cinnamomi]
MAARMSEIGMSAVRASEIGMRHSAANLQMMVGTVANKAHGIATSLKRSTSRGRKPKLKTIATAKAEDELSPMSQQPEPEAEVPEAESVPENQEKQQEEEKKNEKDQKEEEQQEEKEEQEQEQEKELPPLFPWQVRTDDGDTRENMAVKEKILELAIYRRTFVEPADGEEEYVFDYAMLKDVARELLLSNPNLREKRETLVEAVPAPVVSEELFWRNYFLRCNAVRVAQGLPSYLPEVEAMPTPTGALARLRRGLFGGNKKRSSVNSGKSRRGFLVGGRSGSSDSSKTAPSEDDLSDLELDVDGEIEKELVKRRPSRAVELHLQPVPPSQTDTAESTAPVEANDEANDAEETESTPTSETKTKEPEDTPDASSPSKTSSDRDEYAPILV